MAETTNLSKLIINSLTKEQYLTALASDLINPNELYLIPEGDESFNVLEETFTATTGQTLFTLTTGSYKVGTKRLEVYINGTRQPYSFVTQTSSTSFTLAEGLEAGDSVIARFYEMVSASFEDYAHASSHLTGGSDEIPVATQSINGLMAATDKTRLDELGGGVKTVRFVVGTSASGWTSNDCDYLCDGTADDVKINNAITALPATGGEIVILDGTYNITAKIDVTKDNVSIRGNGNATILKRMFDSSVPEGVITLSSRSGCKIANLQIDGNKATFSTGNNHGIYLSASSNNTVTGNTCNNNSYSGIFLGYSSSDNTVTGNTCNNNDDAGIYLDDSSDNNTITGNTCNNNYYGIYLEGSSNNTVTGNTCNNNSGDGIELVSSSDNTVTGNTCNNNDDIGIYLSSSSDNNTITGNTCNNNNTGIYLSSSSDNTITGNTCNNNSGDGIDLYGSSNNTITCNTCNNSSTGIYLSSSSDNNTITGNTCNNNDDYGILLVGSSNNTITGNTCKNNNTGIYLDTSSYNTITGNTYIRGTGLSTDYTASQHTIHLSGTGNNYNLIAMNNCMGKAVTNGGGTGNTLVNNKFDAT